MNNYGKFLQADLKHELIKGEFDVIVGGPPCKPWSAVNLTRRGKRHRDFVLLSRFFKHIQINMPHVFLLENVPLLAGEPTLERHIQKVKKLGYSVEAKIIRYSDYGASTKRHRYVMFGTKIGKSEAFFAKLTDSIQPSKTVKDAIWALRLKEKNEIPDHVWPELKTIHKYADKYKTNKFGWYILNWNEPAPSFGNVMKTYILHPDAFKGENTRVVSVKEVSLIMGFSNLFRFPEGAGLGIRYQMIVDSVSPIFSDLAARAIFEELDGSPI